MLVLTRKVGEEIVIGGNIRVVVIGVQGGRVKVGVDCDREISVHRKEVADAIERSVSVRHSEEEAEG